MDPARWARLNELFEAALVLTPEARRHFLVEACGSDEELLEQVDGLIRAHDDDYDPIAAAIAELAVDVVEDHGGAKAGALLAGHQILHYRIVERLGAGGMGAVYRAEDTKLRRHIALKVLDGFADPDAMKRFTHEARAAARLNHPSICTVHDVGAHDGRPYIAMELLQGQTFKEQAAAGPMPTPLLVDVAIQIGEALVAAHAAGIIHRDIKPQNLFLTTTGLAKILDFGIARRLSRATDVQDSAVVSGLIGSFAGTVAYMSPEQARGAAVDHRTDLFSFGLVLWEMATGVSLPKRQSALDPALARIALKAAATDPSARYQNAAHMVADLMRLKRDTHRSVRRRDATDSIVVQPFVNSTGDSELDYLSRGIAESVADALAVHRTLYVAEPRETDVRTLLRGRLTQRDELITVKVDLVNAEDDTTIWSGQYKRSTADIVRIHQDLAARVLRELTVQTPDSSRQPRPPHSAHGEAYRFYLQGAHRWRMPGTRPFAIEYFQRATALDPGYARAHVALGMAQMYSAWQWRAAEESFRAALELDYINVAAHAHNALLMSLLGRHEDARAAAVMARSIDARAGAIVGDVYTFNREHHEAIEALVETLASEPAFDLACLRLAVAYAHARELDRALESVRKARALFDRTRSLACAGWIHGLRGEHETARRLLDELRRQSKQRPVCPIDTALVCLGLGEVDQTFTSLQRAADERAARFIFIAVSPTFDSIRGEPRFQALVGQLGLPL